MAVVVVALWDQIVETYQNLDNVNLWFLLLMLPLQAAYYHFSTIKYLGLFKILGHQLKYWQMMRVNAELIFVNHVFPSGGVSGFSYFGLSMRRLGVSATKATLVQTSRFVLLFLSFQILVFIGLFLLALDGKANNFMLLVSGSLATLLVIGTLGALFIVDSKRRIHAFFTFLTKILNKLIHVVRPNFPETIKIDRVKDVFTDFHENYELLKKNFRQLKSPLISAILINIAEILTIYAVFMAFGQSVNIGAVIIAYALANFAGLVSVLPGGVGIYEGLMIAVLAAGGVSPVVSFPVIVMYRVLNTILKIPLGGVLYYQAIHQRSDK